MKHTRKTAKVLSASSLSVYLPKIFLALLMVGYLPTFSACQSKELTRARAQKMVAQSDDSRQVIQLDYINRYLKEGGKGTSEATAADEPETSAIANRIAEYYLQEPRVQIAAYLGFVEPHIKRRGDKINPGTRFTKYGYWYFDETWTNTDKGAQLWTDYNLPVEKTTVPLARRELIEVTGITKLNDSQAGCDFTWRWVPNELGKALDPASAEFKALPEDMRQNLTDNKFKIERKFTYDWSGMRTGQAMFRKFDNGWKIEWAHF